MAHQPLQPKLNEASSNADVIGGTLTSQPLSTFFSNQPGAVFNFDQLVDLPFLMQNPEDLRFSSSDSSSKWLYVNDFFMNLFSWDLTYLQQVPLPFVALTANRFHDFDLEVTFLCVKHERARGLYQITVEPGVYSHGRTDLTPDNPYDQVYQRILWDIELTDTITVNLKSPKNFAWRARTNPFSRSNIADGFPSGSDIDTHYLFLDSDTGPKQTVSQIGAFMGKGTIKILPIQAYNAGNVGPDTASVLIFCRLVNLRTAEYSPPFAIPPGEAPFSQNFS